MAVVDAKVWYHRCKAVKLQGIKSCAIVSMYAKKQIAKVCGDFDMVADSLMVVQHMWCAVTPAAVSRVYYSIDCCRIAAGGARNYSIAVQIFMRRKSVVVQCNVASK
jgi:hypothetical protein